MSVLDIKLKYQLRGSEESPGRRRSASLPLFLATGLLVLALAGGIKSAASPSANAVGKDSASRLGASAPDATPVKPDLNTTMSLALESVAQRYRVAPEALQPIFLAAQTAAKDLDPLLVIAVIGIESGFNPFAQSVMGAQGLMQVIPRYHREKLPPEAGNAAFLDPVNNVRVGVQVLQEAVRRQGGVVEGLQYYAGALDDPERGYSARVIAEKQRLEQAVRSRRPAGTSGTAQARLASTTTKDSSQRSD